MEHRQTDNFKVLIDEARASRKSPRWEEAVHDLKRIHADLPDVASATAQHLAAQGSALAPRLANTSIREIGAYGDERLTDNQLVLTVRRTHRSVLMQEASDQMLRERNSVRTASDFMSLKQNVREADQLSGRVAVDALKKQGIDVRNLLMHADDKSLKAVAAGAYDRVNPDLKDRLINALEIQTENTSVEASRGPEKRQPPVMRNPRTQFASAPRQATFGRRVASPMIAQEAEIRAIMHAGPSM